jgi:hypothetical protein
MSGAHRNTTIGNHTPRMDAETGSQGPFDGMPDHLVAAINPYEPTVKDRICANWAELDDAGRQRYREFVEGRFRPSRRKRCKIAAARLAQSKVPGAQ